MNKVFFKKVYKNEPFKARQGIVYVDPDLADEIVGRLDQLELLRSKYEQALTTNEEFVIVVVNALSGTLALAARERFPRARIICVEYFPFEINHLRKLGFEVVDLGLDIEHFSIEYMNSKLQEKIQKNGIACGLQNPPYNDAQSTTNTTGNRRAGHKRLHVDFFTKLNEIALVAITLCPVEKWFLGKGSKAKAALVQQQRIQEVQFIDATTSKKLFNGTETGTLGIITVTQSTNDNTKLYKGVFDSKELITVQPASTDIQFAHNSASLSVINHIQKTHAGVFGDSLLNIGKGPNKSLVRPFIPGDGKVRFVETIGSRDSSLTIIDAGSEVGDITSPAYHNGKYSYRSDEAVDCWRVGLSHNAARGKLGAAKVIPPHTVTSYTVDTFTCSSQLEAEHLAEYLNTSKLVAFIISQTQTSMSISKSAFRYVPIPRTLSTTRYDELAFLTELGIDRIPGAMELLK